MPGGETALTYIKTCFPKRGRVLENAHFLREVGAMRDKRSRSGDRRLDKDMPIVPFKDSNGATIKECRRRIPDRRIDSIRAEWIDDIVLY